ncbi:hypothetical protein J0J30_05995 [Vibrio vulnificus]|nr:hypothetical protein [Vibrio vulnificus]
MLKKFLSDLAFNTFAVAFLRITNVVLLMYFSHEASVIDYASFGLVFNYISVLAGVSVLGIGSYYINNISSGEVVDLKIGLLYVALSSIILMTISLIFSRTISIDVYGQERLAEWIDISSVLIFLYAMYNFSISLHQGHARYSLVAKLQVFFGVLTAVLQIILFEIHGMIGLIYALIASLLIVGNISYYLIIKSFEEANKGKICRLNLRICSFLKSIAPYSVSTILVLPATIVAQVFVSRYSSDIELATYQVALYWQNIFVFFSATISVVILTNINKLNENKKSKSNRIKYSLIVISIFLIIFLLFVYFLSPFIYSLYGNVVDSERFLVFPFVFFALSFISMYLGQWIYHLKMLNFSVVSNLLWLISFLISLSILRINLDVIGTPYEAVYISFFFAYIVQILVSLRKLLVIENE